MAIAARQAYMAQAAAWAREKALWANAQDAKARLKLADDAYQRGDIKVAVRLYIRLALSHPVNQSTLDAKERLGNLADEVRTKQAKIDTLLTGSYTQPSLSELSADRGDGEIPERIADWEKTVRKVFKDYDDLMDDYRDVPVAGKKLKSHINSQRHRPEVAAVLNEPEAKTLFDAGQKHETEDHACCAYWVYRQAAQLAPAPSGVKAQARFAEMEKDPDIVAAAKICRETQQCHRLYLRAERLVLIQPDRARELFAEIVDHAPTDSEVHRAAQQQLADMKR
jgi:hypothetical protein